MSRPLQSFFLAVAILFCPFGLDTLHAQNSKNCDSCAVLSEALQIVQAFAQGTPRSKVEQDFRADGGLQSFRNTSRYVLKKCPSIKVDIEFRQSDGQQGDLSTDPIVKVSRPYLESPFWD